MIAPRPAQGPIGQAQQGAAPSPEQAPEATEQSGQGDKDVYDMIVANMQEFVHAEANSDRIVEAMRGGEPAEAAGMQAAIILSGIVESASQNGVTPTAEVALASAAATISEIVDLAIAAGAIEDVSLEDKGFQKASMQAFMEQAGAKQQGAVPQEQPPEGQPQPGKEPSPQPMEAM